MHSLTDCEISGSPINVELLRYSQTSFPQAEQHPLAVSFTNLRNTIVRSEADEVGVYVGPNSEAVIEHCMLLGGEPVINVQPEGKAFLMNSVVSGGGTQEVISAGAFIADHNVYYPGRLRIDGAEYGPDAFAAYRSTGNDAKSIIADPVLNEAALRCGGHAGLPRAESVSYGGLRRCGRRIAACYRRWRRRDGGRDRGGCGRGTRGRSAARHVRFRDGEPVVAHLP